MEDRKMIIKYCDKEKQFNYINNYKEFLEIICKTFEIDENEVKSLKIYQLDDEDKLIIENENDFNDCLEANENNQIIYILESTIKKEIKKEDISVSKEPNTQINPQIIDNINSSNIITAESQIQNLPLNTNNNNNNNNNNIFNSNIELDYSKIKETIQLENKAFKDEIMNEVKKLNSEMANEMKTNLKKNIHEIKEFLITMDESIKQNNNDLQSFKKNMFESISSIQKTNNKNISDENQINQNELLENLKSEINDQMLKSNINTNNLITSINEKIENLSKQIENKDNIIEKIEKLSKQIEDKNNINKNIPKTKFENNTIEKMELKIENQKNQYIEVEQKEIKKEEINSFKDTNFVQQAKIINDKPPFYSCQFENENFTLTDNYEKLIEMKAYKLELSLFNNGNLPWPINSMIQGNSDNQILQVKTFINRDKEIKPNEKIKFQILISFKNIKNEDVEINLKLNLFFQDKSININQNTFLFKLIIEKSLPQNRIEDSNDDFLTEDLIQEIKNRLDDDYEYSKQEPNEKKLRKKIIKAIAENNLKNLFIANKEKAMEQISEILGEELLGV